MNINLTVAVKQTISAPPDESLSRDLRQAIKVINTEYQQIDWEDRTFLNRVLNEALGRLEVKGAIQKHG